MGVRVSGVKSQDEDQQDSQWKGVWTAERKSRKGICAVLEEEEPGINAADECSIPCFSGPNQYDIPKCEHPDLARVVDEFSELFVTKPGKTTAEYHYIPTTGCPVKVPPRRAHSCTL